MHAGFAIVVEDLAQLLARGADAGQVRRRVAAEVGQRAHGLFGAGARGAARAEGHAHIARADGQHLLGRAHQPFLRGDVSRREKLQAERGRG